MTNVEMHRHISAILVQIHVDIVHTDTCIQGGQMYIFVLQAI